MESDRLPNAFAVSITPFSEDGTIDADTLRAHYNHLAEYGIGVYIGGSGSGEGTTLTAGETAALYKLAASELKGRALVGAMGIEPRTVAEMVELADMAESAGMDVMQVYSPLAQGATADELEAYFVDVATQVRIPMVISIHHAAGYTIPPSVVGHLLDRFPQILGVNCTHADWRLLDAVAGRAKVFVADLDDVLNNLAWGGDGFLCGEANIAPEWCASVPADFAADQRGRAGETVERLVRLRDGVTATHGVRGLKAAMEALGTGTRSVRSPRKPLAEKETAEVRQVLASLGLTA